MNVTFTVEAALATALELHRANRLGEAEALYKQVLARLPRQPDALHLLGMAVFQRGQHQEAEELLRRAIAERGDVAEYHDHMGLILSALGRPEDATQSFRRALSLEPRRIPALNALGRAEIGLRHIDAAIATFNRVLELDPDNADALVNLGVCHYEQERLGEARRCFERAAELAPGNAAVWNNLGAIEMEQGDPDASVTAYERALSCDPHFTQAYCNRLMNELYRPSVTPEGLLELARGWDRAFAPEDPPRLPLRRPRPIEPIRIGFVSADFCRAPVGYFLAGLFRHLDRREVTTIVYSDAERQDDLSAELRGNARLWRPVRALSDEHLLRAIRADGLHVLFNLSGQIRGNRMLVFARRAAPIQVLWVGHAGTTGIKAMDYILADRFHIPEGDEANFSERVLRMPNDYVCYEPPPYAPAVGTLPTDRNSGVTFAAFHNAAKVGIAAIELWARVLAALPKSRLMLAYKKLDDPVARARIERRFSEAGIDPGRLIIEGSLPHVELLRRYGEVDIALDSFPYSGGLTTIEALFMGVPVVTLPGRTFAGRHSLSHASNAGLGDLAASNADDYVRIAVTLAENTARLRELRRTLRARLRSSPILDTARYARDFTALMRGVVEGAGDGGR